MVSVSCTGDLEGESGDVAELPSEGTEMEDPVTTAVRAVVQEYLALAQGGDPPGDFGDDTPFMEAGLDSLDLLKVKYLQVWTSGIFAYLDVLQRRMVQKFTEIACDVQMTSLLGTELGMALPSTLAFDFPTVAAIAAFLVAAPEPEEDVGARDRRRSSFSHLFSLGGPASLTDVFRRCAASNLWHLYLGIWRECQVCFGQLRFCDSK